MTIAAKIDKDHKHRHRHDHDGKKVVIVKTAQRLPATGPSAVGLGLIAAVSGLSAYAVKRYRK